MRPEFVLKNARLIDGSGSPWTLADVVVGAGTILEVSKPSATHVSGEIDCTGLYLAPGFIDIHTHSDTVTLVDPRAMSKVMQGVTTELAGHCGSCSAVLGSKTSAVATSLSEELAENGVELSWLGVAGYLSAIEQKGTSVNIATLVGHGTLRTLVVGRDNRPATEAELSQMAGFLTDALMEGAFGMSSGLEYPPGFFADTHELATVARPMASLGGIYSTHIRNESDNLLDAIDEAVEVGKMAGVPVEISHIKAVGPGNWGKVKDALARLDQARDQGIDVTADAYPYTASSTSLGIILPDWAHSGGRKPAVQRLKDPATRETLKRLAEEVTERNGGFGRIVVTSVRGEANKVYEGKDLVTIGDAMGLPACDAAFRLMVEEEMAVGIVRHGMSPDDLKYVVAHPLVMYCSDGSALAADGPLSTRGKVHPRNFGTFPRVLSEFVREQKVLRLEEAVRKMTSLPAARLGLVRRGLVKPGFHADLVLFDAGRIRDIATYREPHSYPEGIEGVWVNGVRVVDSGRHTGATPGRGLRMGRRA